MAIYIWLNILNSNLCEICNSHNGDYEAGWLVRCDIINISEWQTTIWTMVCLNQMQ